MRIRRPLLRALAGWVAVGALLPWWAGAVWLWAIYAAILAALVAFDGLWLLGAPPPTLSRTLPGALALGVWAPVGVRLHNAGKRAYQLDLFDGEPDAVELSDLPLTLSVPAEGWVESGYRVRARARGRLQIQPGEVLIRGPLGLLARHHRVGEPEEIRAYPNFQRVAHYAMMAIRHREFTLGIHKRRRRGEGSEFFQLRPWRDGDALRQVDWKATSRRNTVISRDYQDEQNQQVVFMLDCGRRLRALDGDLSHFDQALDAALLLTYVALRHGDAVGFQTFGGQDRWMPPQRGGGALSILLDQLFDLQTTLAPPDFSAAAERLMARQRRRALIVLVTNLRDEDAGEILDAVRVLRRRHVVLVASMREVVVQALAEAPVHTLDDALRAAAATHYQAARKRAHEQLGQRGVHALDVEPAELPVALVNRYLDIKAAGAL